MVRDSAADQNGSRWTSRPILVVALLVVAVVVGSYMVAPLSGSSPGTDDASAEPSLSFEEVGDQQAFDYESTGRTIANGRAAVLVADYDGDGKPDVLALGGNEPVLFENAATGFERSNALPDVPDRLYKGGLFFDYDNDGWQDLLLLPVDGRAVFLENDGGTFRRASVGLNVNLTWGTSAAAADYDGNGCPDVFIVQNGDWRERIPERSQGGNLTEDNGEPNLLFAGDCSGFERVEDAGINGTRWSLATSFVDFTGDGRPDIHVANDFNYDRLYVNQGDGTFEGRIIENTDRHGMSSETADVNGDGRLDVFVTNIEFAEPDRVWLLQNGLEMRNRGNNLLINDGNGSFTDRATAYGVRPGGWGWSATVVDFDDDGDRDLVHTTQAYNWATRKEEGDAWRRVSTPPALWERTGETNYSRVNGSRVGLEPANGRGLAVLDFDADGDRDFIVGNAAGEFKLYENANSPGHWLNVRVEGSAEQTALGTRVYVTANGKTHLRVYTSQTNFFSQSSRTLHYGLGDAAVDRVRIVWPDGTERTLTDVPTNATLVVTHDGGVEVRGTDDGS